jgi:2-polyprenyl-6-methoxyphenol hydroxylase-like FAD-dependent oxidoreductase
MKSPCPARSSRVVAPGTVRPGPARSLDPGGGIVTGVTGSGAPVLVVGAGPSGLFAALQLARLGVPARVIEREPHPARQARATALQPGTLEILAQAGLMDEVLESSMHLQFARVFDPALDQVAEMSFTGIGSPWEFQCSLPQWRTEEILTARLAGLGGTVERGTEVLSIRPAASRLLVDLRGADGTAETTEASWVIGAGGAHSLTRQTLAGDLAGETYPGTALAGDVRVSAGLPRDGSALIASPAGYVLLAPLPGGRWITFIGDLHRDEADLLARDISPAAVAACLRRRIPDAVELTDIGWGSTFRMHRRMAPRLAGDRWFLLGDAGHLSSPFGGEGLNSGLHDAQNLAWKLALEIQGRGRPALTGSYAPEREAAGAHVLETSDRIHQMAHAAVESARTGIASEPLSADDTAAFTRARAMLDTSYAASPLTGEYGSPGGSAAPPGTRYAGWNALAGPAHHVLLSGAEPVGWPAFLDRWAGLVEVIGPPGRPAEAGESSAVLIRPDGYVGFRASPADADGLDALDAHLSSYLMPA